MRILYSGHRYELFHLSPIRGISGEHTSILQFVQRGPLHEEKEGTTCQEVLRALIDRVNILHGEKPWAGNRYIVRFLRMALVLFECRSLLIKTEREDIFPEYIKVSSEDLHFNFMGNGE